MGAPSVQGDTSVSMRWYWPSSPAASLLLSSALSLCPPSLLALRPANALFSPILLLLPTIPSRLCCPSFLPFMSLLGEEETCFFACFTLSSLSFAPLLLAAPYREEEAANSPLLLLSDGVITASHGSLR